MTSSTADRRRPLPQRDRAADEAPAAFSEIEDVVGHARPASSHGEQTAIRRIHITRVIVGSDRSASHVEDGRPAPSQRVTELFRDANAERRTTTGGRPGCGR
jgi:hypothetical protein